MVGLTVFFGSAVGAQQGDILFSPWLTTSKVVAYLLIDLALLLALVTSAAALAVHQAEALLDHRRSFAVLAASGVPASALGRVLTRQALIAASRCASWPPSPGRGSSSSRRRTPRLVARDLHLRRRPGGGHGGYRSAGRGAGGTGLPADPARSAASRGTPCRMTAPE
nr:hypothetical protein GCM10020093_088110 [Planobispora longispora]